MNKKLFYKGLAKAAITSAIVATVGIAVIYIQGIEDNADAVSWAILFFGVVNIYLVNRITGQDTY